MKKCCFHLIFLLLINGNAFAQAKSEALQVGEILSILQSGNVGNYLSLFPSYDSLLLKKLHTSNDTVALKTFGTNPAKLQQYDPVFNADIQKDFEGVLKKGRDSGLHWRDIVMARYELERMIVTRDLRGIDKIIKVRLQGYIMIEDMLTRRHYVIAVKDILGMDGLWYGGHVVNVLEAETIDEYYDKLAAERRMEKQKLMALLYPNEEVVIDNIKQAPAKPQKSNLDIVTEEEEQEAENKTPEGPKEVSARIFYTGTFDNQTKVELYMRGLKGSCPDTVCYWEAIYRFQDQDEYIRLDVSKRSDGTWVFDEEPDVGSMELTLKEGRFTGTWISNKDRTEYEVNLKEKKEVKGSKLEEMDSTIENGVFAN